VLPMYMPTAVHGLKRRHLFLSLKMLLLW